jgi:hypothetical protein
MHSLKIISQAFALLKNNKIQMFEITLQNDVSKILPVKIALDFKIAHVNKSYTRFSKLTSCFLCKDENALALCGKRTHI